MNEKQRKVMQVADAILDIVDAAETTPRTDVQGMAEALAMQIINEQYNASA